jgi:triphosphoribosyl-dephospho-CoA synthetase
VEGGYPLTLEALSYLDTQLSFTQLQLPSCRLKDALVDTFFFIVARNSDTNLYARGGLEGVETAKTLAQEVLRSGGVSTPQGREKIRSAEKIFVQKNLSPGGSADILSSTVFLLQIMELAIYAQDAVSLAGNEE